MTIETKLRSIHELVQEFNDELPSEFQKELDATLASIATNLYSQNDLILEFLDQQIWRSTSNIADVFCEGFKDEDDVFDRLGDVEDEVMAAVTSVMNDIDDLKGGMDVLTCDRMNGQGAIYEREMKRQANQNNQ